MQREDQVVGHPADEAGIAGPRLPRPEVGDPYAVGDVFRFALPAPAEGAERHCRVRTEDDDLDAQRFELSCHVPDTGGVAPCLRGVELGHDEHGELFHGTARCHQLLFPCCRASREVMLLIEMSTNPVKMHCVPRVMPMTPTSRWPMGMLARQIEDPQRLEAGQHADVQHDQPGYAEEQHGLLLGHEPDDRVQDAQAVSDRVLAGSALQVIADLDRHLGDLQVVVRGLDQYLRPGTHAAFADADAVDGLLRVGAEAALGVGDVQA